MGIRYRQIYPMIAGVGSAFLGEGFKRKMLRSVLVMEYKLGLRNAKRIFFQNRDDLKVFTDNRILTEDKAVIVNGSGVNLDQFPATKLHRTTDTQFAQPPLIPTWEDSAEADIV